MQELIVIGGGLAGSEAAWQAAQKGVQVKLYEMRPTQSTGAHQTDYLAELVCSNSLGSNLPDRASGLLKEEIRKLGSIIMKCADATALPAGGALAVGRDAFAQLVTEKISQHPNIQIIREEFSHIPEGPAIIASGPLTSKNLAESIKSLTGQQNLFFFDAIAPIITLESINMEIAFRASRFERGEQDEGDYINAPFNKEQYDPFVEELCKAERIELKNYEQTLEEGVTTGAGKYFESCLPVEIIAKRGRDSLAFGPMRPIGLINPHTGNRPHAVIQLRQDNLKGNLYNLVGFQTNMIFSEQKRIFQMIPGLEDAEFIRYGQMHRNTFILSPLLIDSTLQFRHRPDLFFAGQIVGVEGYIGNVATGLLSGLNAARFLSGQELLTFPETTMLGSLCSYIVNADPKDFQPMKANFGIVPPLTEDAKGKRGRAEKYSQRALEHMDQFIADHQLD